MSSFKLGGGWCRALINLLFFSRVQFLPYHLSPVHGTWHRLSPGNVKKLIAGSVAGNDDHMLMLLQCKYGMYCHHVGKLNELVSFVVSCQILLSHHSHINLLHFFYSLPVLIQFVFNVEWFFFIAAFCWVVFLLIGSLNYFVTDFILFLYETHC